MADWRTTGEGNRAIQAWDALRQLYAKHLQNHIRFLRHVASRDIRG